MEPYELFHDGDRMDIQLLKKNLESNILILQKLYRDINIHQIEHNKQI